jgi:hypothetical protein
LESSITVMLRKLALVWMLAWLPISGVMATTMPFCAKGTTGAVRAQASSLESSGVATTSHCDQGQDGPSDSGKPVCEHCDMCQIAGAMVPPSVAPLDGVVPPQDPADASRADFSSFFPQRLPRPPSVSQA